MIGIIGAIVPLAVRLITHFLDKSQADAELRRQWAEFVRNMQSKGLVPSRLRDDWADQVNDLNKPKAPPSA